MFQCTVDKQQMNALFLASEVVWGLVELESIIAPLLQTPFPAYTDATIADNIQQLDNTFTWLKCNTVSFGSMLYVQS